MTGPAGDGGTPTLADGAEADVVGGASQEMGGELDEMLAKPCPHRYSWDMVGHCASPLSHSLYLYLDDVRLSILTASNGFVIFTVMEQLRYGTESLLLISISLILNRSDSFSYSTNHDFNAHFCLQLFIGTSSSHTSNSN